MKKILLIALTALALGLASGGVAAPAVAGGAAGSIGGNFRAGVLVRLTGGRHAAHPIPYQQ